MKSTGGKPGSQAAVEYDVARGPWLVVTALFNRQGQQMTDVSFRVNRIEPPNRPCRAWLCALYETTGFQTRPFAMAFVSEYRQDYAVLDYIIVPDDFRHQGYAKRLIQECQRHWPGLKMTDRIEREGQTNDRA